MKIDPAMLKQINQVITTELKKNKDIKAATDVEKNIDKYISKNKEAIANARAIQQLERRVKELEAKVRTLESQVKSNADFVKKEQEKAEKEFDKMVTDKLKAADKAMEEKIKRLSR